MKVKFGSIVTDGRRKLGGTVYSRNHWGNFARTLVTPANPQTSYQQTQRNDVLSLVGSYNALTETQKNLWADETGNYPRTDVFGDTYYMTAQTLFISLNHNLFLCGESPLTVPVSKHIPTDDLNFELAADTFTSSLELNFHSAPIDTNAETLFYATDVISPGINFVSSKYRLIHHDDITGLTSIDIYHEWNTRFGSSLVAGQKIFIKVLQIDRNCGCAAIPFSASCIIT
jgi:hypothetical protein